MESLQEIKKRLKEWDKYINSLRQKKNSANDKQKKNFLEQKIRWATNQKKKLEDFIFNRW